jgi:hypothetical protein
MPIDELEKWNPSSKFIRGTLGMGSALETSSPLLDPVVM